MDDDRKPDADENEAEVSDEQQEAALRRRQEKGQGVTDSVAPADDDIIIK